MISKKTTNNYLNFLLNLYERKEPFPITTICIKYSVSSSCVKYLQDAGCIKRIDNGESVWIGDKPTIELATKTVEYINKLSMDYYRAKQDKKNEKRAETINPKPFLINEEQSNPEKKDSMNHEKTVLNYYKFFLILSGRKHPFPITFMCKDYGIHPICAKFLNQNGLVQRIKSGKSLWFGQKPTIEMAKNAVKYVNETLNSFRKGGKSPVKERMMPQTNKDLVLIQPIQPSYVNVNKIISETEAIQVLKNSKEYTYEIYKTSKIRVI